MTYSKVRIMFSILQVYWYFYFVGWGKTGPAHSFPPPSIILGSFSLLFSLSVYVTLWLYLNNFEWPIPKRDQVFKPTRLLVLQHCGVGKNWAGPFFPTSKMLGSFYLSSRLLVYVILLLYHNSLDLYQAEYQVFKPTSLFVIVGWGKTGPAHSFPPP